MKLKDLKRSRKLPERLHRHEVKRAAIRKVHLSPAYKLAKILENAGVSVKRVHTREENKAAGEKVQNGGN